MTLKKRIYCRPVSVTLSDDMFKQIYEIAEKEEDQHVRVHTGSDSGEV